jgi:hypothetical protein
MEYIIKFIAVIIATAAVDICWTMYFLGVESRRSMSAATWAVILLVVSAFVTTNWIHDNTLLIAAAIGSFIGTYISIEHKKRDEKNSTTTNENNKLESKA